MIHVCRVTLLVYGLFAHVLIGVGGRPHTLWHAPAVSLCAASTSCPVPLTARVWAELVPVPLALAAVIVPVPDVATSPVATLASVPPPAPAALAVSPRRWAARRMVKNLVRSAMLWPRAWVNLVPPNSVAPDVLNTLPPPATVSVEPQLDDFMPTFAAVRADTVFTVNGVVVLFAVVAVVLSVVTFITVSSVPVITDDIPDNVPRVMLVPNAVRVMSRLLIVLESTPAPTSTKLLLTRARVHPSTLLVVAPPRPPMLACSAPFCVAPAVRVAPACVAPDCTAPPSWRAPVRVAPVVRVAPLQVATVPLWPRSTA